MPLRATCEACGVLLPAGMVEGSCPICGGAARRGQCCAWCAQWVPAGKFCRLCGATLVPVERYGAARMLKDAGVDKFSLAERLQAIDPEQAATLQAIFERHRAVLARRVEEAAFCESFLARPVFAARLEAELWPRLPLDEVTLAELAEGPSGPFFGRAECLAEVAAGSPVSLTRMLAHLARLTRGEGDRDAHAALETALADEDSDLCLCAAVVAAHWRLRRPRGPLSSEAWYGLDRRRLRQIAARHWQDEALRSQLAVVWALGSGSRLTDHEPGDGPPPDEVEAALRAGLGGDGDLRLGCALALGDVEVLLGALAGGDPRVRAVVAPALAGLGCAEALSGVGDWPLDEQLAVVRKLNKPLVGELVEPVLALVERAGEEVRGRGAWALNETLTAAVVERLVTVAERERDAEILRALLRADQLPRADQVVRSTFALCLSGRLRDDLCATAEHGQLDTELVIELLERREPASLAEVLRLAEVQLGRRPEVELQRAVLRVLFDAALSVEVRREACWVLLRVHKRVGEALTPFGLAEERVRWAFGGWQEFFAALASMLGDDALLKEVGVYDWLADLLKYNRSPGFAEELGHSGVRTDVVCRALLRVAAGDYWVYLRTAAVEVLPLFAAQASPEIRAEIAVLRDRADLPADLRYWLDRAES